MSAFYPKTLVVAIAAALVALSSAGCGGNVSMSVEAYLPCNQSNAMQGVQFVYLDINDGVSSAHSTFYSVDNRPAEVPSVSLQGDPSVTLVGYPPLASSPNSPDETNPLVVGATGPISLTSSHFDEDLVTLRLMLATPDSFALSSSGAGTPPSNCSRFSQGRSGAAATLLGDGRVLISGGQVLTQSGSTVTKAYLKTAEIYDPLTGEFTVLPDELRQPRAFHTATYIPTTNQVLLTGGLGLINESTEILLTAELFDVESQSFRVIGTLRTKRANHTATLVSDKRVLLVGGRDRSNGYLDSTEFYDADSGEFSYGQVMSSARGFHSATKLRNGTVLIAGGRSDAEVLKSCEIYRPDTGQLLPTGEMRQARYLHGAASLPDQTGKAVVAGGYTTTVDANRLTTITDMIEVYDPATSGGIWREDEYYANRKLGVPRAELEAIPFGLNSILFVGGLGRDGLPHSSGDVYVERQGVPQVRAAGGTMSRGRYAASSLALPGGQPAIFGGLSKDGGGAYETLDTTEIYVPTP